MTLFFPPNIGIVSAVRSAASSAFSALADFALDAEILRYSPMNPSARYDPATGTVAAFNPTPEDVKVILVDYSQDEIDERSIMRGDQRALIDSSAVSGAAITTKNKLRIQGTDLDIVSVEVDPAGAVYVLQIRQTAG